MATVVLIVRLLLAGVFAVAGLAKLRDREGTRGSLAGFGAPAGLAGPGAVVLPLAELAVAGALLITPSARVGALGALALLAVFAVAIAVNLARGRTPDCNCFGALHSEPVGAGTLVRNAVLAALAVLVVVEGPGTNVVEPFRGLDGTAVTFGAMAAALAALAAAGGWAVLHLIRQNGRLLLRLDELEVALAHAGIDVGAGELELTEGVPVGDAAPPFALADADGTTVSLADLLAPGTPVVLVFSDAGCGPCETLMPRVAEWQDELAELTIAVVSSGDPVAAARKGEEHHLRRLLIDADGAVAARFQVHGTPAALAVGADGLIATGIASGPESVGRLVEMLGAMHVEEGLPLGTPVPALRLPDIDGEIAGIAEIVAGQGQTLVLFWNPDCGFCDAMREDILAWERGRPADAAELLVVSAGDADDIRGDGFRSRVLVDPDFAAGTAFRAGGTPAAVLVGAGGQIGSDLAVGPEAVLALARRIDVGGLRVARPVA